MSQANNDFAMTISKMLEGKKPATPDMVRDIIKLYRDEQQDDLTRLAFRVASRIEDVGERITCFVAICGDVSKNTALQTEICAPVLDTVEGYVKDKPANLPDATYAAFEIYSLTQAESPLHIRARETIMRLTPQWLEESPVDAATHMRDRFMTAVQFKKCDIALPVNMLIASTNRVFPADPKKAVDMLECVMNNACNIPTELFDLTSRTLLRYAAAMADSANDKNPNHPFLRASAIAFTVFNKAADGSDLKTQSGLAMLQYANRVDGADPERAAIKCKLVYDQAQPHTALRRMAAMEMLRRARELAPTDASTALFHSGYVLDKETRLQADGSRHLRRAAQGLAERFRPLEEEQRRLAPPPPVRPSLNPSQVSHLLGKFAAE